MKRHKDEDLEFKDEGVKDVIETKSEFKKRGGKDNGIKPSTDKNSDEAGEASKSKFNLKER